MSEILSHQEGGVLTLVINRPDRKNAFTAAMYQAMADHMQRADGDSGVKVLVFQGHETVFSAGNDIADFLNNPPRNSDAPVFGFMHQLAVFSKPMIAAVNGPAVGIGTTLLFHCDLVYAGDNAAFAMPFVNLGLCPEAASSLLAPQLMGFHRAAEALLLGEPFLVEAALEMGLVNKVFPPSQTHEFAQGIAKKLASKPLQSLLETKRLLKKNLQSQVLAQIQEEAQAFGRMLDEPAAKEAFAAFLEKRKPDFSTF